MDCKHLGGRGHFCQKLFLAAGRRPVSAGCCFEVVRLFVRRGLRGAPGFGNFSCDGFSRVVEGYRRKSGQASCSTSTTPPLPFPPLLEDSSPGSSMAPPSFPSGLWRSVTSSETLFPPALEQPPSWSVPPPTNVALFFLLARYHYLMSLFFWFFFFFLFFGLPHEGLSLCGSLLFLGHKGAW